MLQAPRATTRILGRLAASLMAAAAGFLWWNTSPARIFMGDTGSQAMGGAMAALALLTNTHLLLVILGGLLLGMSFLYNKFRGVLFGVESRESGVDSPGSE